MRGAILIDANSFSKGKMRQEIEDKLLSGELVAITSLGTKLEDELLEANTQFYINLRRASRFITICPTSVENKIKQLEDNPNFKSDDPHMVAVAITSAVNVLVSLDEDLAKDFKNCRSLDQQTKCRNNNCLGKNVKTRKVIGKKTRPPDVNRFLRIARCRTKECPCIKLGQTC